MLGWLQAATGPSLTGARAVAQSGLPEFIGTLPEFIGTLPEFIGTQGVRPDRGAFGP